MSGTSGKRRSWSSLFLWHRYLGLLSALFVIVLALTGLMLNHSHALKLNRIDVTSTVLLDWYGIRAPAALSFPVRGHWVSQLGERLYFDRKELLRDPALLLGVIESGDVRVITLQHTLLLVDRQGGIIERLGEDEGVPAGMRRLGLDSEGRIIIDAAHGYYRTDRDFLDWQEVDVAGDVSWPRPEAMPESHYDRLRQQYRGSSLNLERVLLDLHSGRLLAEWGVYLMDAAAVCLLLLALLGIRVWLARRQRRHPAKGGRTAVQAE